MATYYPEHDYDYVAAPAPPPPHAEFVMAPPPPSAFSPSSEPAGHYYPPQSPLVVAASPAPSRNGSRHRASMGEYISAGERNYLAPGGYSSKPLGRSLSERGRDRGQALVEAPRRRSRARSGGIYPDPPPHPRKKYYIDDDGYSHSGSSYGGAGDSRDHSRDQSRHRHYNAHSRTPSCGSTDSRYDDRYALAYPQRPSKMEEELTGKLKEVQRQLERVQVDAEKKRMLDEQQRLERQREVEIERKVKEQMQLEKRKEAERAKKEKDALEAEKRRIAEAAKKLLEEQAAAVKKQKEEEDRKKAEIKAIVEAERQKYAAASSGKKTYTRFSKTHLCKEALEERNIPFTEETDYFLVHRFVEKNEQQYLWERTKEIRNYFQQIQEAADKAPTVRGPNGGYVKYVHIHGQPYPIALPVTITSTPGGGQTQRVDPVKIKWSDIFKSTR